MSRGPFARVTSSPCSSPRGRPGGCAEALAFLVGSCMVFGVLEFVLCLNFCDPVLRVVSLVIRLQFCLSWLKVQLVLRHGYPCYIIYKTTHALN
ncbi:40S ribosomal protein S28, partial [Zea mays]